MLFHVELGSTMGTRTASDLCWAMGSLGILSKRFVELEALWTVDCLQRV